MPFPAPSSAGNVPDAGARRELGRIKRFPRGGQGLHSVSVPPGTCLSLSAVRINNSFPRHLLTFVNCNIRMYSIRIRTLVIFCSYRCSRKKVSASILDSSICPLRDTEHLDVCLWGGGWERNVGNMLAVSSDRMDRPDGLSFLKDPRHPHSGVTKAHHLTEVQE